jgi:hypothetical protein
MKYFLMLVLGFVLHKGLEEAYEYKYESAFISKTCMDQYLLDTKDVTVHAPLTKRFRCTEKEMGVARYLAYVLIRPHWSINNGKTWYY